MPTVSNRSDIQKMGHVLIDKKNGFKLPETIIPTSNTKLHAPTENSPEMLC